MLPVMVLEPVSYSKRRHYADILREPAVWLQPDLTAIKQRLEEMRSDTLDSLDTLVAQLKDYLTACSGVDMTFATDSAQAINRILEISGNSPIATNKSAVITRELMRLLTSSGSHIIESYYDEFRPLQSKSGEHLQFPPMPFESRFQSFSKPADLIARRLSSIQKNGTKNLVGLLGVNAVSAEDGSVVVLQHMSNISKIFEQAREIILVVGLDKIVRNLDDALFQAKCMAVFGSESLSLSLYGKMRHESSIDGLPFSIPAKQYQSSIHLILLDNGRSYMLNSRYKKLLACIDCRACNGVCPAYISDKPLTPSELPLTFRNDLLKTGIDISNTHGDIEIHPVDIDMPLTDTEENNGEIWDCTTCGNCNEICPASIAHVDTIHILRMSMVMEKGDMPDTVGRALKSIEDRGHPWRGTTLTRTDWAQGLDIKTAAEDSSFDILYWVGCTQALEERSMNIARAMGKLFALAGIKAAYPGVEESCCGEPARRMGNEYLFRVQVKKNIELMKRYNVRKVVTACPHCYYTMKNDYPLYGGDFEVIDHLHFIMSLLKEGRLIIPAGKHEKWTYHDPCFLGRFNGVYDQPRQILQAIPGVSIVEMELNRERSFCCGGGGGHMWMEESRGQRIGELRFGQAIDTGAQKIATACPYCLQMFEDAGRNLSTNDQYLVMDIAELIAESGVFKS
ncbi:MAG: heterodisulfide reductase-related iron-sulfur binding cluster [Dehalococcoidia bacterium]